MSGRPKSSPIHSLNIREVLRLNPKIVESMKQTAYKENMKGMKKFGFFIGADGHRYVERIK